MYLSISAFWNIERANTKHGPTIMHNIWFVVDRSYTWPFELFELFELQKLFLLVCKLLEMHWCESVCPHEVRHRSHIERHINVFVFMLFFFSFSLSLVLSIPIWLCPLFRSNLPTFLLLACGFVSCFFSDALAFIVLSIPRLNCGLSLRFFFFSLATIPFVCQLFVIFHQFELTYSWQSSELL